MSRDCQAATPCFGITHSRRLAINPHPVAQTLPPLCKKGRFCMPTYFPSKQPDGTPANTRYYSVDEAAPKLHVGRMTLREKCRRNLWPHLRVSGRYFLSDDHLARIVEMHTVNPDIPDPDSFSRPRLVADEDTAGGVR